MRAVIQAVSQAEVSVAGERVSHIDNGYLILVAVKNGDDGEQVEKMARRIINLRMLIDDEGKINRALDKDKESILLVSQFTLYGDTERGRRPSFVSSAKGPMAKAMFNLLKEKLSDEGYRVETGVFGEKMKVSLSNEGPITLIVET